MSLLGFFGSKKPSAPRYLLIGGSNCLIKEGFGVTLQARTPGEWTNRSLGNSPSLRGVEYLLNNLESLDDFDYIIFEYALNDLIFEITQTLDPQAHLSWLRILLSNEQVRSRLVFVQLYGQGAAHRIATGHSFVIQNYANVIDEFGARVIDLCPLVTSTIKSLGSSAVFKDNDHFSNIAVDILVTEAIARLNKPRNQAPPPLPSSSRACRGGGLVTLNSLHSGVLTEVVPYDFHTSLVSQQLAELGPNSAIRLSSPGGTLVGFYVISSPDAGCLRITHRGRDYIKSLRNRFGVTKQIFVMRHLSLPISTALGDEIIIRQAGDVYAVPDAIFDQTMGQVVNAKGGPIHVGSLLFLTQA